MWSPIHKDNSYNRFKVTKSKIIALDSNGNFITLRNGSKVHSGPINDLGSRYFLLQGSHMAKTCRWLTDRYTLSFRVRPTDDGTDLNYKFEELITVYQNAWFSGNIFEY